jgi:hypothetical protein
MPGPHTRPVFIAMRPHCCVSCRQNWIVQTCSSTCFIPKNRIGIFVARLIFALLKFLTISSLYEILLGSATGFSQSTLISIIRRITSLIPSALFPLPTPYMILFVSNTLTSPILMKASERSLAILSFSVSVRCYKNYFPLFQREQSYLLKSLFFPFLLDNQQISGAAVSAGYYCI